MDYQKFYSFYKLEANSVINTSKGEQMKCDCPFCKKGDNHLFVNLANGLWECKKCSNSGNHLTFITKLHDQFLVQTTEEDYRSLSKERSIPIEVLQNAGFAYRELYSAWYVPYKNGSDFLNNLGVFYPNSSIAKNRFRIFKAPELELKVYRPFNPKKIDTEETFICEGEWDALAMYSAFRAAKQPPPAIMAIPGANVWKPEWNKIFEGKSVVFFLDDDEAGEKAKPNLIKKIKGFQFAFANWSTPGVEAIKEKATSEIKDVRDIWKAVKTKSKVLEVFTEMSSEADITEEESPESTISSAYQIDIDSIPIVSSHKEVTKTLKGCLYTNKSILQTVDMMFATAISVNMPGEPLWIFVKGPPSCGKSTVIEAFGGNNKYFDYVSKLTATALISGHREGDSQLPKMDGKTLFIKDLTVLLGMPEGIQQQLWDLLRDCYDGYVKIPYGNGPPKEFTGFKFCCIAGVTGAIDRHNDSDMGARWLKMDFLGNDFDEDAHMDFAMSNAKHKAESKSSLLHAILGYYRYLAENFSEDKLPPFSKEETPELYNKIKMLARLVARLRTKVASDRYEGLITRPESEVASRLGIQFQTSIRALGYVRQEEEITNSTYEIVKKLAFDSSPGLGLEVAEYLFKKTEASAINIVNDLRIPRTRVQKILTDFQQLDIVSVDKKNNGKTAGRDVFQYSLTPEIMDCLSGVKIQPTKKKVPKRAKTRK